MKIKEIRNRLGLSLRAFGERYKIPLRTLENWEGGQRTPPDYVLDLLESKVKNDLLIIKIANDCAAELGIACPKIQFGTKNKSIGNIAGLVLDSKKNPKYIAISDEYSNIFDALFATCHELRHVYQAIHYPDMFKSYQELGTLDSEIYNLQEAEIDANAYASLFIELHFGMSPLFNGYPAKVKAAIEKRKSKLIKEE